MLQRGDADLAFVQGGIDLPRELLSTKLDIGEQRLDSLYRPWIVSEASERELDLIDFEALFLARPDWELLFPDGVHPFTDLGRQMMADEAVAAFCRYVPEPTVGLPHAFGWLAFLFGLRQRGSGGRRSLPVLGRTGRGDSRGS